MSLPNLPSLTNPLSQEEEDSLSSLFPQLSYKERLIGFACCYALGILISLSSFGSFADLLAGEPLRFAVLYSMGNMTSLCSTLFLVGLKRQIKNMTKEHRRVSAGTYLTCMVLTPVVAYTLPDMNLLIIVLVVVQWASLTWYSLSYIPFGRTMARGLANSLLQV